MLESLLYTFYHIITIYCNTKGYIYIYINSKNIYTSMNYCTHGIIHTMILILIEDSVLIAYTENG